MRPFEITEHTADVGIRAFGASREELFANAALGMFSIIGDVDKVEPADTRTVSARADDGALLLAAFLSELLYAFEVDHFMFHDATVEELSDTAVRATVRGERISPRHDLATEIKAVTHHGLTVEDRGDGWEATVLFDI